jgi:chromosome segregation ATPase
MTKAETVFSRVEEMVAAGTSKADAFKKLAEEFDQPVNSVRGAYYQWSKAQEGPDAPKRTRRRETTPEDALADARRVFERAIEQVDAEVEAAKSRLDEAKAEHESLKASAQQRKEAIQKRLEALV